MVHKVTLLPSGRQFTCAPQESILIAGLQAGAGLPFSCRSGVCRTCRGKVVAGSVDTGQVHPAYLSEAERAEGFAHLCQASALGDCVIEIDELDTSTSYPLQQMPARVLSVDRAAPDVMILTLGLPPNEPLRYHAGQYLDIVLGDNLRRSYSMASAPLLQGSRQVSVHIRHMPGGVFSDRVFTSLKLRELLRIEAPLGQFYMDEASDKPIIFLASGTGFAPIKAMVEHALTRGWQRPMHIYWGGRTRPDLYMDGIVHQWVSRHSYIRYTPVLSEATLACAWDGRTGLVHQAVMIDYPDLSAFEVYACGAPAMVNAARQDFTRLGGLAAHDFHADAFVSEADKAAITVNTRNES